ncbi:hypothetical protein ACJJTC_019023 [Scirpophaga incertulas]
MLHSPSKRCDSDSDLTRESSLEMRNEIKNIRKEYSEMKQSVQSLQSEQEIIKKDVETLQKSVQFNSDRQDDFDRTITSITLETKKLDILQKELDAIKDINMQGNTTPVYISEHLTYYNKILLNKCKEAAKTKNYQFVWTKNGRIYTRKCDTAPALLINSEEELKKM